MAEPPSSSCVVSVWDHSRASQALQRRLVALYIADFAIQINPALCAFCWLSVSQPWLITVVSDELSTEHIVVRISLDLDLHFLAIACCGIQTRPAGSSSSQRIMLTAAPTVVLGSDTALQKNVVRKPYVVIWNR